MTLIEISGGFGGFVEWVRGWALPVRVIFFGVWVLLGLGILFNTPLLRVKPQTAGGSSQVTQQGNAASQHVGVGSARSAQANAAGGSTAVADNRSVHIGDVYNGPNYFGIPNVGSSRERRTVQTPSGATASADIYVLWQEGSWHFNSHEVFLREGLNSFLNSSLLQNALTDSSAIVCVGLASNEAGEQSATAADYNADLSNRRAFRLCDLLAGRTAALHVAPKILGVGLGHNTLSVTNADERQKQRAVVFIAVRGERTLSRADIDAAVREILRDGSLTDFHPQRYSRVVSRAPLCWVMVERGTYRPPNPSDCS